MVVIKRLLIKQYAVADGKRQYVESGRPAERALRIELMDMIRSLANKCVEYLKWTRTKPLDDTISPVQWDGT